MRFEHTGSISSMAVQTTAAETVLDVLNDFNGDGRSDVLWRDSGGTLNEWLGQMNGSLVNNAGAQNFLPSTWHVIGTGDYNGDTYDDILWRHDSGRIIEWLGGSTGSFTFNSLVGYDISTNWQVVGTGDFNNDNNDDILWMNDQGVITDWLGQDDGTFTSNSGTFVAGVPTEWHVIATGDFNGDGWDDILWKNDSNVITDWLGTGQGSFTMNSGTFVFGVPVEWHIVGVGDFDGDNRDDLLWMNNDGVLTDWLGQADGSFTPNSNNFVVGVPAGWHVIGTGNYNGDTRDDILWRSDSGLVTDWLGQANGGFTPNSATFVGTVPNDWHIQPEYNLLF